MNHIAAILLLSLTCACQIQKPGGQNGVLIASIEIGPICPHEPCNLTPKEKIAFYNDFQLVIADSNGIEKYRLPIDTSALIRKSLTPGMYSAGIRPRNFPEEASLDLKSFRIETGKESNVQVFFDTGLR